MYLTVLYDLDGCIRCYEQTELSAVCFLQIYMQQFIIECVDQFVQLHITRNIL